MSEQVLLTHLAKIRVASLERSQSLFEMLQQRFGYDGDINSIYSFDAEISNNLLDSHYTRMSVKTLHNYAEDAQKGVAFLQGHQWRGTAIGYSLSGEYQTTDSKNRVLAGFYTVLGMQATDDLVKRIKSGLSRDVSVGFSGGSYTCDICGRDIWDWDCRHVPGLKYEEKRGDETYEVISTFTIDNARLSEVSDVFDGSTPDAMILRAQKVVQAGGVTPEQIDILEQRYRMSMRSQTQWDMGNLGLIKKEEPKERKMTVEESLKESMDTLDKIRSELGLKEDEAILEGVVKLKGRVKELEPQAEEGLQYRKDLLKTALEEGVRAYGNDFEMETYRSHLENAPLALIKRQTADWKRTADAELVAGRQSQEKEQKRTVTSPVPDSAFA